MFYKDAKVYSDGSHYIAIPHTSTPCKRKRVIETPVEVPEEAQSISISSDEPEMQEIMSQKIKDEWDFADMAPVESNDMPFDVEPPKPKKKYVKRSEVFEKLYAESDGMSKNARRKFLCKGMSPYFTKEQDADAYVASKLDAKLKSLIARKTRFIRKAYINDFNYFVTFTYDDSKHDETSFRKKLLNTLSHLQARKEWRYMGVWERAPKTKRLHFHGLFYIPEGTIPGEMIEVKDYNINSHKMQLTLQSEYFNSRFGRNDFERVDENLVKMGNAMSYILKYIDKTHEKIVYSRKLPVYVISDIDENDVLCGIGIEKKKLLLQDKFMCYDEGEQIGVISQKTKSRLRTSN